MLEDEKNMVREMNEKNIAYFSALAAKHGASSHGVGWSQRSQMRRFQEILKIGDLEGSTVLDIGCGFGDFFGFLRERGIFVDYTGFDITPVMLKIARQKYPDIQDHFRMVDILSEEIPERYDYVVSNGPLNVAFGDNLLILTRLIQRMYEISNVGMAITMTSALTKRPNEGIYYYDPAEIVRKVSIFCQNFVSDHGYLPHDFALFCYRKSLYD
jgi:SAM-dependent methyltransferase